ncbi:hypothetical protein LO771_13775 [Streptacidiphilus sp. ASG 303]|uniref:hypothetical protein n=1 Tax=Streptacidiphilus sp. ASG 303 TaxID=2896847 RepID=UPI001E6057ED|nr:hypothetical protein [Streptacidiphilus sp. ASG 303]MCD0483441.1 hypothetical protein [Streptacidiphilus sp. ASG 303]
MRTIVSGQYAATAAEFVELALGIDTELFTGPAGPESPEERAARLDVAGAVLADLRREDPELAAYATALLATAPVPLHSRRPTAARRPATPAGVAA